MRYLLLAVLLAGCSRTVCASHGSVFTDSRLLALTAERVGADVAELEACTPPNVLFVDDAEAEWWQMGKRGEKGWQLGNTEVCGDSPADGDDSLILVRQPDMHEGVSTLEHELVHWALRCLGRDSDPFHAGAVWGALTSASYPR